MKIGVVSDTHNRLPNVARIVELLNHAGVDRVVLTGDITQPATLELLARLDASLHAVYGNNDAGERAGLATAAAQLGIQLADPPLELRWAQRRLLIVHDPRDLAGHLPSAHDLALHGHTHRYQLARGDGRTVFNPGECAGTLAGHNAVGVVDLATMAAELLRF